MTSSIGRLNQLQIVITHNNSKFKTLAKHFFSVCLSDTKLEQLYIKRNFKDKLINLMGVIRPMDKAEFEDYARRLYKCCLKSVRDLHELHLRRELGKNK